MFIGRGYIDKCIEIYIHVRWVIPRILHSHFLHFQRLSDVNYCWIKCYQSLCCYITSLLYMTKGCKHVNWTIWWRHQFHFNVTLGRQITFMHHTHNAMKTIMFVIYVSTTKKHKFYGKCLMNLTYHITPITNMRDCSFWTLSNCVTYSFTTTTPSSLLKISCYFASISFNLHYIWITNSVRTCGSICC